MALPPQTQREHLSIGEDQLEYAVFDVFTHERFRGNALAVVFVDPAHQKLSSQEKQKIAREFNFSETVFVNTPDQTSETVWNLTIMTPFEELSFAGHPLIGAACALSLHKNMQAKDRMLTKAGLIDCSVKPSSDSETRATARAEVSVPFNVHLHSSLTSWKAIGQDKLGNRLSVNGVESNVIPVFSITKGMTYILIQVPSMEALSQVRSPRCKPDIELDSGWGPSFVGSYFYHRAPSLSEGNTMELHTRMVEHEIGEDPVTGSAACALAAHLSIEARKAGEARRDFEYRITQGEHMGRPGTPKVHVKMGSEEQISSMNLIGDAVRVMHGVIER